MHTTYASNEDVMMLFDIFEISIDHSLSAFTTRSEYHSHWCLHCLARYTGNRYFI